MYRALVDVLATKCPRAPCKVAAGDFLDGTLSDAYLKNYKDGAWRDTGNRAPRYWALHAYATASHHTIDRITKFLKGTAATPGTGKSPYIWLTEQGGVLR
jgi:hypothetical protein